jgi:predicted anti-sigma-YlaC factor YlaD
MKARNIVELLCQEVVELVTEYLSRAMAPAERVLLEQHLLTCPPCTAYLEQARSTLTLARGLGQDAPEGGGVDASLIDLYRRWNRR